MHDIDFVITWVDGNDPAWQAEKARFRPSEKTDSSKIRYRDWDNLQYWFRAVETYAPWVRKIHFVTWGHRPAWLNTDNPKLAVVNHRDYIPPEYLPTFSSRAIDMNFHRIGDLAEHFVYFNDDMFLTAPVRPEDFFEKGLPAATAILNASILESRYVGDVPYAAPIFDLIPINRHFKKAETLKQYRGKYFSPRYGIQSFRTLLLTPWKKFPGFMNYHLPYSYLRSTYEEVWEKEGELLDQTCRHRFRTVGDLNHWVFDYWQLASGRFSPRRPTIGTMTSFTDDPSHNREIGELFASGRYKMMCLNDAVKAEGFEKTRDDFKAVLETVFPEKSSFEK